MYNQVNLHYRHHIPQLTVSVSTCACLGFSIWHKQRNNG